ncbi:DUF3987 domain-containing protein [Sphingobium sp. D43FB]|uniref:DUF3987 domain-containing protein n=1 Tax=Sphingobium sp. D43FB TaxID=2017595 RepID=UPI000BB543BD|nr:DUF3987 domain-containing protein [Sphingobium sp. D43FB]PBN42236.1 hypothetical protein SxD43FB_17750 [Sphingobium sp. D43FB]
MEFPLHLLPVNARTAIEAQAALGNYPIESVGTAALAIMSHASQGLYNVDSLQRAGHAYPLSQLFLILSPSGDAKSSIYRSLMGGIETWQVRMGDLHAQQMQAYETDKRQWERRRAAMDKDNDVSPEDRHRMERQKPTLPRHPWNTPSKTTTNGIFKTLQEGWPTYGLFTAEGGSLLAGHSLKAENSPAEFASAITNLWDGDTIDRTTGDHMMRLRGRRLSGLIMVQSAVAGDFLTNVTLRQHGIHARFLIVSPCAWQPIATDFTDPSEMLRREQLTSKLQAFCNRIDEMLSYPLETREGDDRELVLATMHWSGNAKHHMLAFQNRALEMRVEEETFFKRTFEHACRMAGVLTAYEGHGEITLEAAQAATALIEFYGHHWRTLDVQHVDERDARLSKYIERVLRFLRTKGPATMRDLTRNPLQRLDLRVREAVMDTLIRDDLVTAAEETLGTAKTVYYSIKQSVPRLKAA